jgi:hypothetical protein
LGGSGAGAAGFDTSVPNVARIYDYILGGKDNFAADRQAAQQLLAALPDIAGTVRDNRSFIGRVVRFLAGQAGIRQFLDLGAGLPTQDSVHELAQAIAPDARVVYVDNDPVACSHGQALLGPRDKVGFALGDLRRPAEVLRHPEVLARLDFSEPVACCVPVPCTSCRTRSSPIRSSPGTVITSRRAATSPSPTALARRPRRTTQTGPSRA